MKKLFILLFLPFLGFSQAVFDEGIQNTAAPTDSTPAYFTTTQADGVHKKTPAANIEKTTNKISTITTYSEVLYPNEKAVHDGLDAKLNISDLPTNLTLYPTTTASDVGGYVVMVTDIHDVRFDETAVDVSSDPITTTNQLLSQRISDAGVLVGQPGVFNITTFGNIRHLSGTGTATFYFKVYHRDSSGVETLICTSSSTLPVTNGGYTEFSASGIWDDGTFDAADRIVIKVYADRIAGGTNPVYQFQFGGATPVRTILPVPFSVVDAGYEMKTNKQNSLAVDGTGVKYPTVDAVNTLKWIKSNESLALAQRKGDVLYGILDRYTGEEVTLSKVTGTPTVDGIIYFQLGSEYFRRVFDEEIDVRWFGNDLNTSFRDRLVLTVSGSATTSGNLRLVFNNIFFNISISNTDTINDILIKIRDAVYTQNDKVIIGNTLEMTNSSLGELRFSIEQIPVGLSITSSSTNIADGSVVRKLNIPALNFPNTKYIISQNFNLEGQSFDVPDNCILHFTKTGSLSNGEIKGNNTTITLDDDGDVFNSVYFVGNYLKSSQVFNYKTMQDLKSAYKSQFPSKICLTQGFWFKDDGGGAFYQLDTHENLIVEYAPYFDSFYNGSTWDGKFVQVNSNLDSNSCVSTPYAKMIRVSENLNLAHFGIKYDANFYDSTTKKWYVDAGHTILATDNYRNFQAIMPQLRLFVPEGMPKTIVMSGTLIINTTVVFESSVSSLKLMNSGHVSSPVNLAGGGPVITSNSDLDVLFDFTAPGLSVVLENLSFFGCDGRIKNGMICRNGGENEALSRLTFANFFNAGLIWLGISSSFKIDTATFFHNKIGLLITNVNTINKLDVNGNPTEIFDVSDRIMSGNRISGDNNSSALIQIDGLNPKNGTIYKFPLVLQLRDIKAEGLNDAVVKIVTGYTGTRVKIDGIVNYPTLATNRSHLIQIKNTCISTPSLEISNYINYGGDITQGVDIDDELNGKKILLNGAGEEKISSPHIIYTAENEDATNGFMVFRNGVPESMGTTRKSGTTAQRPTITSDANSFKINKGLSYFDTTLGIPIFVKNVTGSVIDWFQTPDNNQLLHKTGNEVKIGSLEIIGGIVSSTPSDGYLSVGGFGNGRTISAFENNGSPNNLDVSTGISTPNIYTNNVRGSSDGGSIIELGSNIQRHYIGYSEKMNISSAGMQVNGTVSATSYTGSATLTGTPTAPTATLGTNTTQIATTAFVLANASGASLSANNTFTGENTFSNHTLLGAPIVLKSYTVATLPEGLQGDMAYVTDAVAPTYLVAVVGGGMVKCPVFYNGTTWVSH